MGKMKKKRRLKQDCVNIDNNQIQRGSLRDINIHWIVAFIQNLSGQQNEDANKYLKLYADKKVQPITIINDNKSIGTQNVEQNIHNMNLQGQNYH